MNTRSLLLGNSPAIAFSHPTRTSKEFRVFAPERILREVENLYSFVSHHILTLLFASHVSRYERVQNLHKFDSVYYADCVEDFETQCQSLKHNVCKCCHMVSINLHVISKGKNKGLCDKCKPLNDVDYYLKRGALPVWWKDGVPMYRIPEELSCLTHAEKMLIQRVSPFVPLHHIRQGVLGIKGHVCAFEQDIGKFMNKLPRSPKDVTVIKVPVKSRPAQPGTVGASF